MGLLSRILSAFRPEKVPDPLDVARAARRRAAERYAAAVTREDSRNNHWTLKAYRRATNELLHLEKMGGAR
jgi:hypothetical protein